MCICLYFIIFLRNKKVKMIFKCIVVVMDLVIDNFNYFFIFSKLEIEIFMCYWVVEFIIVNKN